ncbi:MAG: DNA starvation/stationary phase protection protein Dps [Planctomycetota bacterium]|nr:DNA starvation/stationary phase protection protein Dps [Planctomycetota bacterium]
MHNELFPSSIRLPEGVQARMIAILDQHLADAIDVQSHAKHAHWNLRGPHFAALHALFDEVAEALEEHVDDLAERIVQLGGSTDGTTRGVTTRSKVPAYPSIPSNDGLGHASALARSLALFANAARGAIRASSDAGDDVTADLFTGVVRGVDKLLWMVESHVPRA